MASVQDRLRMNRALLDKWTVKEQLCLASAVSCSGDQNWMSVSRTLKLLCGHGSNRPSDWFSQKSCALQYGFLLENVETPRRKKRASEGGSGIASPAPVETPTDLILRRLTEERVQELKSEIRKEQEEYAKIYTELKAMQGSKLDEDQLLEIWRDIEKQQEKKRIEEMKLENQIREREQRRQEMQRSWRPSGATMPLPKGPDSAVVVDMDVEEIIGTNKPGTSMSNAQVQSGPSPLLSSLLKSPTSSHPTLPIGSSATSSGTPSARVSAPTITTLLTSGSIPNSNQPAITLKSVPPNKAVQLLSRPISGPPVDSTASSSAQILLSPSQSAPTLSMLLEKSKTTPSISNQSDNSISPESKDTEVPSSAKLVPKASTDSNNEEVPMDIEEDVLPSVRAPDNEGNANDTEDTDPNEEQQLLEVFQNIGNIDELDIDVAAVIDDEEVDFLKGVDMEASNESSDALNFENKANVDVKRLVQEDIKSSAISVDDIKTEVEENPEEVKNQQTENHQKKPTTANVDVKAENSGQEKNKSDLQVVKCKSETTSSDDSNDNIPLATVVTKDIKDPKTPISEPSTVSILKEEQNSNDKDGATVVSTLESPQVTDVKQPDIKMVLGKVQQGDTEPNSKLPPEQKTPSESENTDVLTISTKDDVYIEKKRVEGTEALSEATSSQQTKVEQIGETAKIVISEKSEQVTDELENLISKEGKVEKTTTPTTEVSADAVVNVLLPPTISIADTDEESSTTDASISNVEERKLASIARIIGQYPRKSIPDTSERNDSKTEDDSSVASSSTTPARPPAIRKLRDRDRSESPMIDDEVVMPSDHSIAQHRSRKRCSSTPVNDSIPNSPASSVCDDRETRASKKTLLTIYNALQHNKNVTIVQRVLSEHNKYEEVCRRPMDLQTIKKSIESGFIRHISELQRDVMLMCQNAMMLFHTDSTSYKAAYAVWQDCQSRREFLWNSHVSDGVPKVEKESNHKESKSKVRSSARKSQRNT